MKGTPLAIEQAIRAQLLDDAAATSYVLDLASYPGAKSILWLFAIGATDVAPSVMKIQEDDAKNSATALTSASEVHDFATKPGTGSDGGIFGVLIPLDGNRERYQQAAFTAGNGTAGINVCCLALVIGPDSDFDASSMGLTVFEQP